MRSVLEISGAPIEGILQTQRASACLRVAPPCGAKAGAFLTSRKKILFHGPAKSLNAESHFFRSVEVDQDG
jgi:hypothetical protein